MTGKSRLSLVACSLWLISLWLVAVCVNGAEKNAASQLDAFLEGLNTYEADFTQTLLGDNNQVLEQAAGKLYLERPGKFRWEYTRPYTQTLICDGSSLWVYDKDLEQVTIRAVGDSLENTPAALLGGDMDVGRYYSVDDEGRADNGIHWMTLTPRESGSQYRSVRLGFRDRKLARMILFDSLGQKTELHFSNGRRNPRLDEQLFHFTPPQGVDVIDNSNGKN